MGEAPAGGQVGPWCRAPGRAEVGARAACCSPGTGTGRVQQRGDLLSAMRSFTVSRKRKWFKCKHQPSQPRTFFRKVLGFVVLCVVDVSPAP